MRGCWRAPGRRRLGVIDGVTHALQLDDAERAHLVHLLHTAGPARPPRRTPTRQQVRTTVRRVIDSMSGTPAFVLKARLDILIANALGLPSTHLFSPIR